MNLKRLKQLVCLLVLIQLVSIPQLVDAETNGSNNAEVNERNQNISQNNAQVTVTEENIEQTGYFKVIKDSALVYMYKNDTLIAVADLMLDEEFTYISSDAEGFVFELAGQQAYVKKTDVIVSNGETINNSTSDKSTIKKISIERDDIPVYQSDKTTEKMGLLHKGNELAVYKDVVNGYFVHFGGRSGFIMKKDVSRPFNEKDKYFTTLEDVPVYIRSGGKMTQKGNLIKGTEFYRVSGTDQYHHIKYGDSIAHVAIGGTIPSDGSDFSSSNEKHSNVYLTTSNPVWLYTKPNLSSEKIAVLPRGQKYPILEREGTWFTIHYGGHKAYIHPSQAKTIYADLVNGKKTYTYDQLGIDVKELEVMYNGLVSTEVIGKSVDGRNIYAVKVGKGKKEILLNGSHHAREHMTTNVLMEMIDSYAMSYVKGSKISGYKTNSILNQTSIWFVPMVNPDGVTLVQKGHLSAKNPQHVLKLNGGKKDFSAWKANVRGIDLNRQYPPNWNKIKGPKGPAPKNFKGYKPLSEPEVVSLVKFVRKHKFKSATAYHSSGNILYWHYHQKGSQLKRDMQIAKQYSKLTGYRLVKQTKPGAGGGGFKDWFITETKMTGFTPEISPYVGERPVPNKNFPSIWKKNHAAGLMLANDAAKR